MDWDVALFKKTPLGAYRNCLALLESYANCAPSWVHWCLTAYLTIGSALARCSGADTTAMWRNAESIIGDIFAASRLSPRGVIELLHRYVKLKLEGKDHLPFEQACAEIYEQPFYPLVTHFTFALQPSAIARLRFVREVAASMTDGPAEVADLGCGSGLILNEVLQMKPFWSGHGLDISPASVDYAKRLAAHKRVAARVEFVAGDIAQLPFEDESLDLVIASEVMEHVPEPGLVLMGISRVLRPGGQLVITIPLESHTPAHLQTFRSPEEFLSLCETAGLNINRVNPRWHFSFGDDRRHLFAQMEKPAVPWADVTCLESTALAAALGGIEFEPQRARRPAGLMSQ